MSLRYKPSDYKSLASGRRGTVPQKEDAYWDVPVHRRLGEVTTSNGIFQVVCPRWTTRRGLEVRVRVKHVCPINSGSRPHRSAGAVCFFGTGGDRARAIEEVA
jgi:hypothetical protein